MDNEFNILRNVNQVAPSPFLWTRIQQKIEQHKANRLAPKWAFSLAAVVLLVISVDFVLIKKQKAKPERDLVESMSLMPQNDFYHE
ncbi:MAG: hypothetical protein ACRCYO_05340 [Bacteroidia bacterium]